MCVTSRIITNFLILSGITNLVSADDLFTNDQEVLGHCCEKGENVSVSGMLEQCTEWQVPIPNVPEEFQDICIATMEVCCWSKTRDMACQQGQELAKEGQSCHLENAEGMVFDQTLTECCLACNIGAMTPSAHCSRLVNLMPSPHAQSSFVKCCFGSDMVMIDNDRCPDGYIFNEALEVCDDIDECANAQQNLCDPNFEMCVNTIGNYLCNPILNETESTNTCPPGFKFFLIDCIDIDECEENAHNCSRNQICVNTEGSFRCDQWDSSGPLLCPRGYRIDPESETCVDINECLTDLNNCNEASQRCVNTLGSFRCIRHIPCGTGYTFNTHSGRCEDNNEW